MTTINKDNKTIVADSVNVYESDYNSLPRALQWAKLINEFRVVPRIFMLTYTFVFYEVVQWALAQEELTIAETGFVGVIAGLASVMFSAYTMTTKK